MTKTRIYELAKELGLENKAVLDMCDELGIDGKKSHSSSLSDVEAERIRRYVIRRAVSDRGGPDRELHRDGSVITERRVGSVIRRRKRAEEEEEAEEEYQGKSIDFSDLPGGGPRLDGLSPDLAAERRDKLAALERANALFSDARREADTGELDEARSAEAAPEKDATVQAVESPVEAGEAREAVDGAAEAEELAQEMPGEEDGAAGAVTLDAETEAVAAALEEAAAEGGRPEQERLAEFRRRHDIRAPKVLGKIELAAAATVKPSAAAAKAGAAGRAAGAEEEEHRGRGGVKAKKRRGETTTSADDSDAARAGRRPRRRQVLSKAQLLDYEGERDVWKSRKEKKSKKGKEDGLGAGEVGAQRASKSVVKIDGEITVSDFAKAMGAKVSEVMAKLLSLGVIVTINQYIDFDTATLIAAEFGYTTINTEQDAEALVESLVQPDAVESLTLRPPVVTVMGHVDHGKTSLLDAIRHSSIAKGEVGGITQHIGAYNVVLPKGGSVTFLDTPGHEAFTAMRSRGAKVTDIVVLVVAADDGVMPQTIEAINHARSAGVPIIVALNKIDKHDANQERVITQLAEHNLIPEGWGGDTIIVPVSAHTKIGIDLLLENLYVQAEVLELKANAERAAVGTVVESRLDRGRGPVISVLVQNGTLKRGDVFVAGAVSGRVRALVADDGSSVESAGPSIPVEVLGADAAAVSGDDFIVMADENQARSIADERAMKRRLRDLAASSGVVSKTGALTLERLSNMISAGELKELPIIIKADVQGSVEAVSEALLRLSNEEVRVNIIHRGVGAITENDVQLASASKALLIGFNVRADVRANRAATAEGIEIVYSRIIYELLDEVQSALKGMMKPKFMEKSLGRVEVRQTFRIPRFGMIAGSYVLDGVVHRNSMVRLLRDSKVVFEGKMASLRRFKDDVKEVAAGYECGIALDGYSDIKDGDTMEVYTVEQIQP